MTRCRYDWVAGEWYYSGLSPWKVLRDLQTPYRVDYEFALRCIDGFRALSYG